MIVKLTPKTSYEVEIDGVKIPGAFVDDGKWNGMQCVKGDAGKVIFTTNDTDTIMEAIFGSKGLRTTDLVSASPSIIAMVMRPN